MDRRYAHLNLFVTGYGYHEAAWKVADVERPTTPGLDHYVALAQLAERGVIDVFFLADGLGVALFRTQFMAQGGFRSEERRVGKECVQPCRSRWSPYH